MNRTKNVAIFASGNGSNAEKIIQYSLRDNSKYRVRVVFTNNPNAGVIDVSKKYNVPHFLVDSEFNIIGILRGLEIELISLAGFLKKVPNKIINNFYTINIHPSLLPKYGGKGMYGINVHKEVIKNKEKESGMTIHHVTSEYDKGAVLYKYIVNVNDDETPESLQRKIQKIEHDFYPLVIDEACRTLTSLIQKTHKEE